MSARFVGYVEANLPHVVEVASNLPEFLATLSKRGVRFVVTTSREKALGWCDDQRGRCYLCEDGKGLHTCSSCQEVVLLGRLHFAVFGVTR